ncbi:hypothetical protein G5714_006005 [Onychostoma macrolepis]|uniref:Uncharacterized protein n=1 Tax=Onychostoma macrolepis TaxID=369639 RepID=A0A7J6D2L8_9TELE|nr:hypothetical protein G5714_006005 [Onychostoma macrolepis]
MATVCKICAGPIEPPDQHDHCVACLGLAHAEAALVESDCGHCADLPARVLRTRRDMIRGLFGVRPTAASVPLVGPPSPGGGSVVLPLRQTQRSPHSPVSFPEDCFRPPSNIGEFVSFGQEEGDDTMSISASEREDWAGSEPDQTDSSGSPDLQEELMRVLSRAVQELELTWSPPEEPARSKLDSWSSSAPGFSQRRDNPRPATAAVTATASPGAGRPEEGVGSREEAPGPAEEPAT